MGNLLASLSPQQIIILLGGIAVVAGYALFKWKRASGYVEKRNEVYSAARQKEQEYAQRARQDKRWPGFLKEMQSRCSVSDNPPGNDETFQIHYISILDHIQKQYEPNEEGSEQASIYAFLKRKAKPKFRQYELQPGGGIIERKISRGQWYDLFEKSI